MKFAVVVIFYNPDKDALRRIELYARMFNEVWVIDNSEIESKNISIELKQYPNCIYHKMNGNQGIARALNIGFDYGVKKGYDFVLTMDQDSVYDSKNMDRMIKYIESHFDPSVGIYSPNYAKLYFDVKKNTYIADTPVQKETEVKSVDFCMTSGSFVNVSSIQNIVPLEDYFIAYVDDYLCTCLLENKYKLLRVGESIFSQQVGGDVKNTFFNRFFKVIHQSDVRYYYMIRNNLHLQKRFKRNLKVVLKCNLELIRLFINIVIAEKHKVRKVSSAIHGYRDFRKGIFGKVTQE